MRGEGSKWGHVITFVVANFVAIPSPTKPCHAACELKKRTGFTTSSTVGITGRIYLSTRGHTRLLRNAYSRPARNANGCLKAFA